MLTAGGYRKAALGARALLPTACRRLAETQAGGPGIAPARLLVTSAPVCSSHHHHQHPGGVPSESVIRVPRNLQRRADSLRQLQKSEPLRFRPSRPGRLLIACRRPAANQTLGYTCGKFEGPSLASKGWKHRKAFGDYFVINPGHQGNHPAVEEDKKASTFGSLGLCSPLIEALETLGIARPTAVQLQTIPKLLRGQNVLCAAETGSGKTFSYLLPAVHALEAEDRAGGEAPGNPRCVVLVPSRELADQVQAVARSLSGFVNLNVRTIGGGRGVGSIKTALSGDVADILVATPGALWKALKRDLVTLSNLRYFILDESDTLFDDSFIELVEDIFLHTRIASNPSETSGLERKAQLVVIGATFPGGTGKLLSKVTDLGSILTVKSKRLHFLMPHVKQKFLKVKGADKATELMQLLRTLSVEKPNTGMLIFCNSASTVNWLGYILDDHGIKHLRLQGQMPGAMRAGIFKTFQKGSVDVLICTDIASRGLDTGRVEMVVNFDFPPSLTDYIHRAGRVGRVGSKTLGTVINYVTHPWDVELVQKIEAAARKRTILPGMESAIDKPLPQTEKIEFGSEV
ncbi:probable ATP-dependent RNA helicase DDX28 [Latimeria chalumnae]|uniref:RNA helicase n=1 Tax=Latimeria chalumnae TaxID=7897 RepID=H3A9G7_LATCH|nr:PREDICTED: probable ATP-dependent RNA helicase DDX28 [Latimeria chalumnae]|eukprot:XP_006010709.1 PREDICTED: probable ATP-dependent RNA helicase DDX28 [Latimeria chalumnae]